MKQRADIVKTLEVEIEGLGFSGEGYARTSDGRFISVHHTLPGDRVRVGLSDLTGKRSWGEIEAWLHRDGAHVDPQCRHYDQCTGCALRHLSVDGERDWKMDSAREILARYGPTGCEGVPLDWVDGGGRSGYRVRGSFRVVVDTDRVCLGLRSTAANGIVDVRDCTAQSSTFRSLMVSIGAVLDANREVARSVDRVEVWTTEVDRLVMLWPVEADQEAAAALELALGEPLRTIATREQAAIGIADGGTRTCRMLVGKPTVTLPQLIPSPLCPLAGEGLGERVRPGSRPQQIPIPLCPLAGEGLGERAEVSVPWPSWYHPNSAASASLGEWVTSRLSQVDGQPDERGLLDLCAGVGTMTFRLASLFDRVLAVDMDYAALCALESAAAASGLEHVTVRAGRMGTILAKLRAEVDVCGHPTTAVVNPMRRQLAGELDHLVTLGVTRLIYLGPSPVSAARDAERLSGQGFEVIRTAVVNLYPSTARFMLAFEARRS